MLGQAKHQLCTAVLVEIGCLSRTSVAWRRQAKLLRQASPKQQLCLAMPNWEYSPGPAREAKAWPVMQGYRYQEYLLLEKLRATVVPCRETTEDPSGIFSSSSRVGSPHTSHARPLYHRIQHIGNQMCWMQEITSLLSSRGEQRRACTDRLLERTSRASGPCKLAFVLAISSEAHAPSKREGLNFRQKASGFQPVKWK
jgi:hypothetical protein